MIGWLILLGFIFSVPIGLIIWTIYGKRIREGLIKFWIYTRYPEKALRIIIRYPSNKYDELIRIMPNENRLKIGDGEYFFDEKDIIKKDELKERFLCVDSNKRVYFEFKNKKYYVDDKKIVKRTSDDTPTIEYFYNCPSPIVYEFDKKKISLSSKQLKEYKENDLVSKLLSLKEQDMMLLILLIGMGLNAILTIIVLCKQFGLFDK